MEIIAEVGLAHDGSLTAAHAYIDACANAGVNGVKFQCHLGDPVSKWRLRPDRCVDEHRQAYWLRTGFSEPQWLDLARHCADRGVEFLCSVFSIEALKLIDPFVKRHKIPSGRIADLALLDAVKATGKPVILSSGMGTILEIRTALDRLSGVPVTLMSCASMYPTPPEKIGLSPYTDALSDHSGTIYPGIAAAALGCSLLEVHVCWSKDQGGLDTAASLTIDQLRQLVEGVRFVEKAMQPVDKDKQAQELAEVRRVFM